MALSSRDIQRTVYFDPTMKEHVCIAFIDADNVRYVLGVSKSKQRALAVRNTMQKAKYRFECGPAPQTKE